jgi:hypothetical protein
MDSVVCKNEKDFVNKLMILITGNEKTFIPQKADQIDKEDLLEAEEAALEEDAAFIVPSVISSHSIINKDKFKPYIIVMSKEQKMFVFPYNGESFSDLDKKGH